jgi:DNA-binding Lrp family transcriptional regulator
MAKAFVLFRCESGRDNSVISDLKRINSVKEAHGTFGTYDVIAKLESDNESELRFDLTKKIRNIPNIRSTLTLMTTPKDYFGKKLTAGEKYVLKTYMAQAYVLIDCTKNAELDVLQSLNKIPEVIEGDLVVGYYGALCKLVAPTFNDISEIITKKIRKMKNIKSTNTLNVIPENE